MKKLRTFEFLLLTCATSYVAYNFNKFPADFFLEWKPISFYKLLDSPLSETSLLIGKVIWFFSLFLAGLGVLRSPLSIIGGVAGIVTLGHHYNFGNVYHGTHLYIGALFLTCFFPYKDRNPELFLKCMKVFVVFVMCLTGLQKLYYGGGLDWAFTDSFYVRVASNPYHPFVAKLILEGPLWFSQLLAAYSLFVVEVLSPVAMFKPKFGRVFFWIWSSFHIGVTLLFTNHYMFYSQIFIYAIFLDLDLYALKKNYFTKLRRA